MINSNRYARLCYRNNKNGFTAIRVMPTISTVICELLNKGEYNLEYDKDLSILKVATKDDNYNYSGSYILDVLENSVLQAAAGDSSIMVEIAVVNEIVALDVTLYTGRHEKIATYRITYYESVLNGIPNNRIAVEEKNTF